MLLSNEELKEKVKIRQDTKLKRWLNENRIYFWLDGKKRPITTVGEIERSKPENRKDGVDF